MDVFFAVEQLLFPRCKNLPVTTWVISYLSLIPSEGAGEYDERFPDWEVADLNQSAFHRPRYGVKHVPTLTTGCSRMRLRKAQRYIHGTELLVLQGLPATPQIAKAMRASVVAASDLSHRAKCFVAGNMMHASSIGFMLLSTVLYVRKVTS